MGNSNNSFHIGYRILSIDEDSPLANLGLEPMIDFIILPQKPNEVPSFLFLENLIKSQQNDDLELSIFNIATRLIRKISVKPLQHNKKSYLGITARAEDYANAHIRAIHVLSYLAKSPLEEAGFIMQKDYILGTRNEIFSSIEDFESFIKENDCNRIDLFVYNTEFGTVRKVRIIPRHTWGGPGILGGEFGFGLIHAIPKRNPIISKQIVNELEKIEKFVNNTGLIPDKKEEKMQENNNEKAETDAENENSKINNIVKTNENNI